MAGKPVLGWAEYAAVGLCLIVIVSVAAIISPAVLMKSGRVPPTGSMVNCRGRHTDCSVRRGRGIATPGRIIMQRTGISSIFTAWVYAIVVGFAAGAPIGAVFAQGAPQSITEKRVDVVQLATGYRASKLIGSDVQNSDKDKIGTVDDIIISPANQESYAILSVGGFLGMGNRLVAVPFKELHVADKRLRMEGASKDGLRALPEFRYAKD